MPDGAPLTDLIARVYPALATGDRTELEELLAPDFVGRFCQGMPAGAGVHEGPQAAIADGWWAIGREFAVKAEPDELIGCDDGRMLVLGHYRGRERATGRDIEAVFSHLWSAREGRLTSLVQVTDTARWMAR